MVTIGSNDLKITLLGITVKLCETAVTYTRKNLIICSKSANKPSTSCVRTACYKLSTSLEQAVNNL